MKRNFMDHGTPWVPFPCRAVLYGCRSFGAGCSGVGRFGAGRFGVGRFGVLMFRCEIFNLYTETSYLVNKRYKHSKCFEM